MKEVLKKLLLAVLVLGVGVGLSIVAVVMTKRALASKSWPTVEGRVTFSDVTSERDSDGKTMYSAAVRYTFTVDGRSYETDRISQFKSSVSSAAMARSKAAKYPVGKTVAVHYDPANPPSAMLEVGMGFVHWLLLGFALILDLAGIGAFVNVFKKTPQPAAPAPAAPTPQP